VNPDTAPQWISTQADLQAWADRLQQATWIAIDTESDSFHRFREKVCLVQMTALGEDVLIDPLALGSLDPLKPVLENPAITKIFHDAGYDLICLRRDFGVVVRGLFDTMLASRILGERHFGLAALLRTRYAFEADKRLQRSDWAVRPLSQAQMDYARYDTHFLPQLALDLTEALRAAGRLSWALEDFARLPEIAERAQARSGPRDPDSFWRVQGVKTLSAQGKGMLKELYQARERIAERLDRPAFKVMSDDILMQLAHHPPAQVGDLSPRPGARRSSAARFGHEIMEALAQAQPIEGPPPKGHGRRRRNGRLLDPRAREVYEALRVLRKERSCALGLEPEVLMGNALLEELASRAPLDVGALGALSELRGWRGPHLIEALAHTLHVAYQAASLEPAPDDDDASSGVAAAAPVT
jgi:ribonuclease D